MQRPAEQLKAGISRVMLHGKRGKNGRSREVALRTLQKWWGQADEVDARMRLDGSPLNRRGARKRG